MPAKMADPVVRNDHVVLVAEIEIAINVVNNHRIQINVQRTSAETVKVLSPQRDLRPLPGDIAGNLTAQWGQWETFDLASDTGGVIGKTDDAERPRDVPRHHPVKNIHILGPVNGPPFDANDLFVCHARECAGKANAYSARPAVSTIKPTR